MSRARLSPAIVPEHLPPMSPPVLAFDPCTFLSTKASLLPAREQADLAYLNDPVHGRKIREDMANTTAFDVLKDDGSEYLLEIGAMFVEPDPVEYSFPAELSGHYNPSYHHIDFGRLIDFLDNVPEPFRTDFIREARCLRDTTKDGYLTIFKRLVQDPRFVGAVPPSTFRAILDFSVGDTPRINRSAVRVEYLRSFGLTPEIDTHIAEEDVNAYFHDPEPMVDGVDKWTGFKYADPRPYDFSLTSVEDGEVTDPFDAVERIVDSNVLNLFYAATDGVFNICMGDTVCTNLGGPDIGHPCPDHYEFAEIPGPVAIPVPTLPNHVVTATRRAEWIREMFERVPYHESLFQEFSWVIGCSRSYSRYTQQSNLVQEMVRKSSHPAFTPVGNYDMIYCEILVRRFHSIIFQSCFAAGVFTHREYSVIDMLRAKPHIFPSLKWIAGMTSTTVPWHVTEQLMYQVLPNMLPFGRVYVRPPNEEAKLWRNLAANTNLLSLLLSEDHIKKYEIYNRFVMFLRGPVDPIVLRHSLSNRNTNLFFVKMVWCTTCRQVVVDYESQGEFVTIYPSVVTPNFEVLACASLNPMFCSNKCTFSRQDIDRAVLNYYTLVMSRVSLLLHGADPKVLLPWIRNDLDLVRVHQLNARRDFRMPAKIGKFGSVDLRGCHSIAHKIVQPNLGHGGNILSGKSAVYDRTENAFNMINCGYSDPQRTFNETRLYLQHVGGHNNWKSYPRLDREFYDFRTYPEYDWYGFHPELETPGEMEVRGHIPPSPTSVRWNYSTPGNAWYRVNYITGANLRYGDDLYKFGRLPCEEYEDNKEKLQQIRKRKLSYFD